MGRLVALALPGGPAYATAIRRVWDAGDAIAPLDLRLPRAESDRVMAALRPGAIIEADGEQRTLPDGLATEDGDAAVVATSGTSGTPKGVIHTHASIEAAAAATRGLFAAPQTPDAIFVGNDHMAFAVMDELRKYEIPVSVVGYDDVPLASWGAYKLTTVRQPVNRMVEATIDTLLGQINAPETPPQKIEIDGPLILRTSARIPKDWTS